MRERYYSYLLISHSNLLQLVSFKNQKHDNTFNIDEQNYKRIPSRVGISGNETADIYAKRAINSPETSSVQICSLRDIMRVIQSLPLKQWQHRWASSQIKLNEIKLSINPWPTFLTKKRYEVVINRLRIESTWLTHT